MPQSSSEYWLVKKPLRLLSLLLDPRCWSSHCCHQHGAIDSATSLSSCNLVLLQPVLQSEESLPWFLLLVSLTPDSKSRMVPSDWWSLGHMATF